MKSLALIQNYLTNRSQYIQFENQESCTMEINTGIPQGSILGPLFYSILVNDLVNSSKMLSFLMYADDTTIYFNLEDFPLHNRYIEINTELDKVNNNKNDYNNNNNDYNNNNNNDLYSLRKKCSYKAHTINDII